MQILRNILAAIIIIIIINRLFIIYHHMIANIKYGTISINGICRRHIIPVFNCLFDTRFIISDMVLIGENTDLITILQFFPDVRL